MMINKDFKFYDLRSRGSFAEALPYRSYCENALFFKNLLLYSGGVI